MYLRVFTFVALSTMSSAEGIKIVPGPGIAGSGMPHLAASRDGGAILSWLEPAGGDTRAYSLRIARWRDGRWQDASTVRTSDNWFVNWADFPSVIEAPDGSLYAHWLERTGGGKYGYAVTVARAPRWSGAWRNVFTARPSDPEDYSGFLSWTVSGGQVTAAYLAPPATPTAHDGHEHRKTLRTVTFRSEGAVESDVELDADTCSCCPTAIASTGSRLLVAYRDRSSEEIRDISFVEQHKGRWTTPKPVHTDGWRIHGCPTDGPSMTVHGDVMGIAWTTRADDKPRVYAAFSKEWTGFSAPVRVDEGNPLGRPATAWLERNLLVVWLEKTEDGVDVRLRQVSPNGSARPSLRVAAAPAGRGAGFPKVAVTRDGTVLVAWRDGGLRTAAIRAGMLRSTK